MGSAKEDMCERIPSSNCAGRVGSTRQRYGTRLPVVVVFSLFFDGFPWGGLLRAFVSAVLQVTYDSAARRILSRASERASSSSSGRVSSGIVIDEGFPLTINNVSFEKLVVYVLCALMMKAFGLLSCFFLHHLAALKVK
jgi:hypothetical protein